MNRKPWDSRLAHFLIRPLRSTRVSPNHLTTLGLLCGIGAGLLFAVGERTASCLAGALYMASALLDHTDGELARLANKSSRFGFYYDQTAGAVGYVALFVGIGIGLRHSALGHWAILLGIVAGASIAGIFGVRFEMEKSGGRSAVAQPTFAGFEIEDIMYLVGPIAWLDALQPFLVAAAVGAPLFGLWQFGQQRAGATRRS